MKVATPSLRSALRLSQPPDGLLRSPASWACSIPRPRPGFLARSGASRSVQPPDTFMPELPPCRSRPSYSPYPSRIGSEELLLDRSRAGPRTCARGRRPRLRASTSRLSSTRSSVASVWCYPPRRSLPSSGSFLLQVPTVTLGFGSPKPSALEVLVVGPSSKLADPSTASSACSQCPLRLLVSEQIDLPEVLSHSPVALRARLSARCWWA